MTAWSMNKSVAVGRVIQVTLAVLAAGFSIALCFPWFSYLNLTISAAYLSIGIAICGLLALLAMNQSGSVHWMMVLMLDLLALACCGGAAGVMTAAFRSGYFGYEGFSTTMILTSIVLDYICMATLLPITIRSFLMWRHSRHSQAYIETKEIQKHESWYNPDDEAHIELHDAPDITPAQLRFSQDRHSDFKSVTSTRPLSTIGTVTDWSSVSGATTLTQAPSVRSAGTKRPPSYASPIPSRAPTMIVRKPVNGS